LSSSVLSVLSVLSVPSVLSVANHFFLKNVLTYNCPAARRATGTRNGDELIALMPA